jgi:hypothetical protein
VSLFSADWLDRREPHDQRARNPAVLAAVAAAFTEDASVSTVDLACGTGATVRALAGALPMHQHWRLVDNDLGLLARAKAAAPPESRVNVMAIDLVRDLEASLDGPVDLVTTSAFLDLVSEEWLERLVTEIAARRLPFYAALSYDGRIVMTPADEADATIVAAFNRHQTIDKGFGPALGPASAAHAVAMFERLGYAVVQGPADWQIEARDPMYKDLVSSIAGAASELVGVPQTTIEGWATRRRIQAAAGRSTVQVGHLDFFAHPTERR